MAAPMTHTNPMQQIINPCSNITSLVSPQHQRECDILFSRQSMNKMEGLKHNPDCFTPHRRPVLTVQRARGPSINHNVTRSGVIQPSDKIEKGTLPTPTRTDKRTEFALPNFKIHIVQGGHHGLTA
jgi:hypothetical protein